MARIEIDIAFRSAGLIVLDHDGAIYSSQVYGNACGQVAVTGFFVPLDETLPEYSPQTLEDALGDVLLGAHYLTEITANQVDEVLSRYVETSFLRVDREHLRESGEAWVYVDIMSGPECPIAGPGPWKGVLAWPNSD